jgi:hypothetical protein
VLEQHGYPPLLLSFESQDGLDHVLFVFRERGRWGAVACSRDPRCHGASPCSAHRASSRRAYMDAYVDLSGRVTGFAVADLRDLGAYDWRLSPRNVRKVERWLIDYPHRPCRCPSAATSGRSPATSASGRVFRARRCGRPTSRGREAWL